MYTYSNSFNNRDNKSNPETQHRTNKLISNLNNFYIYLSSYRIYNFRIRLLLLFFAKR